MPEIAPRLFALFDADGLAIQSGNVFAHTGDSPNTASFERLSTWFKNEEAISIFWSDSLLREFPLLRDLPVAGAVALKLDLRNGKSLQIWLFRKELLHEVEWGGNPNKPVEFDNEQLRIAPRQSFDKWVEKRKGYSSSWTVENRLAAKRLRQLLIEIYA